MNAFSRLLVVVSLLLSAASVRATTSPHYAVTISATIITEAASTGSNTKFVTIKINNASILRAFLSGTAGTGLAASDLDIVLSPSSAGEVDLINKTSHATLFTVMDSGTTTLLTGGIVGGSTAKATFLETVAASNFNIPGQPQISEFISFIATFPKVSLQNETLSRVNIYLTQ